MYVILNSIVRYIKDMYKEDIFTGSLYVMNNAMNVLKTCALIVAISPIPWSSNTYSVMRNKKLPKRRLEKKSKNQISCPKNPTDINAFTS